MERFANSSVLRVLELIFMAAVVIFFILAIGWGISIFATAPQLSIDVFATTGTFIAIIFALIELKRSKFINEANLIMQLNHQFISDCQMARVETKFEKFFSDQQASQSKNAVELDLDMTIGCSDRQNVINYLVYLEGLAAIMERDVMDINLVDNVFAYRFFLALNNPVVQHEEIIKFAEYYHGCYRLYYKLLNKWKKENRNIPLKEFSLFDYTQAKTACSAGDHLVQSDRQIVHRMLRKTRLK